MKRLGPHRADADDAFDFTRVPLENENGVLVVRLQVSSKLWGLDDIAARIALLPISDDEAIVFGSGNGEGGSTCSPAGWKGGPALFGLPVPAVIGVGSNITTIGDANIGLNQPYWTSQPNLMTHIPASKQTLGLLAWLILTFAAAAIGAVASADAGAFYQQLTRPAWAPPGWLFAPVWSVLYVLIGISAWLVWRERGLRGAGAALSLFLVQLAANALWTWLFFVWHLGAWAFAEILILWVLIVGTVATFWRVRPTAGALLLPYLAWVTFACALTFSTWQLNPQFLD